MPNPVNAPESGQPVDRLSLAVSAPRGASPQSNPSMGCYCSCACFADDDGATPSYPVTLCGCNCFADEA